MTSTANAPPSGAVHTAATTRFLPLMLLLFVGSGCAALIYQIVWFQVLQLVVGSSAISLAVLLGTFMGGMFLGSLLLTRYVSRGHHPLMVYAKLEVMIGVMGAALIVLMPLVGRLYTAVDGGGPTSIVLRAIVSILLLLPPTILMGATLPAIARYVESTPKGVSWLGFFYAGNIAGAVIGCLAAGFYLLRVYNLATAALVAVALNALVAGAAVLLSKVAAYTPPAGAAATTDDAKSVGILRGFGSWQPRGVYVAIALSGLTALGAEVVWTRLLSLMFGATTYAFSVILAVFLIGLGIGSVAGSAIARDAANPRVALGWTQLLLAFTTAWAAWVLSHSLPYWPVNASIASSAWFNFQLDLARAMFTMLPGAILWGASFPIALAAATTRGADPGVTVGRVYAANTFGAIAGAVGVGIVLIPFGGTQGAQRALIVLAVISALVALLPLVRRGDDAAAESEGTKRTARPARTASATARGPARTLGVGSVFGMGGLAIAALWLVVKVTPVPAGLVAWGRSLPWQGDPNALYVGEGINSSIAVTEEPSGYRNFHVSGKVEASTEPQDMRLQRLLGHLSALMHDEPKSVLVVGFGAGVTAGAISIHPTLERMVICEMEPLIPRIVSTYFRDVNYAVADNPRVEIKYDDARHYVLTTREKFDVITSDPIHPWVKGAATLYTKEYFEHVKAHLNPGGVVTQWVPLYESTEEVVKSEIATFLEVFPNGTVWRNDDGAGAGYDIVLVGRLDNKPIDVDAWQAKIDLPEYAAVKASLADVGYYSVLDVLMTYSGGGKALAPWIADGEINRDSNLRLQYLAGFGFNYYRGTEIRDAILRYRVFPPELFTGSEASLNQLRGRIMGGFGGL
ncbi:MAG: fused MFS/spermidine synthase [Gemmatimonadetes bacterium]|nr:fused MFS/spermidine synthase [Gemmatimonadota bacterium]